MFSKLEGVEERFLEIEKILSDPAIVSDREAYQKYAREHSDLNEVVSVFRKYKQTVQDINDSTELLEDNEPEIKELAKSEIETLSEKKENLEEELKLLLTPRDPYDDKNVIVEIRAGTGGEEAALFASDLFRMYGRYAENRNWKIEILNQHVTGRKHREEFIRPQ